jgi:phosphate starvation-inducible PhoH-like protein
MITITGVDPVDVLGANDSNLRIIRTLFPKLNLVARGDTIKVTGADTGAHRVRGSVPSNWCSTCSATTNCLARCWTTSWVRESARERGRGRCARLWQCRPAREGAHPPISRSWWKPSPSNDMVFAIGPAGTGKTYTAVALGGEGVEGTQGAPHHPHPAGRGSGGEPGFLPGDLREKLDPYLQPLYDALKEMIPATRLADHLDEGSSRSPLWPSCGAARSIMLS